MQSAADPEHFRNDSLADLHISPSKFGGKVELAFSFDRELPQLITKSVPSSGRKLIKTRRVWVLDEIYLPKLVQIVLATGREVIDHREATVATSTSATCTEFLKIDGAIELFDEIEAQLQISFDLSPGADALWQELRIARKTVRGKLNRSESGGLHFDYAVDERSSHETRASA